VNLSYYHKLSQIQHSFFTVKTHIKISGICGQDGSGVAIVVWCVEGVIRALALEERLVKRRFWGGELLPCVGFQCRGAVLLITVRLAKEVSPNAYFLQPNKGSRPGFVREFLIQQMEETDYAEMED
jgi:hypothetical protein